MLATAVETTQLHDVVRCPGCHKRLEGPDGGPRCGGCGARYESVGAVTNFLGPGAVRTPEMNDVEAATWLFEHRDELGDWLRGLWSRREGVPRPEVPQYDKLREFGCILPGDPVHISEWGIEVANDLRRISGTVGDTEREIVRFVASETKIDESSRVADVGCSSGLHLRELVKARGAADGLVGVDVDLFSLLLGGLAWEADDVPGRVQWLCASGTELPLGDESLTNVVSIGMLGLLPVRTALAEMWRVLEPGGQVVLMMESHGYWRRQWDHARTLRRRFNLAREMIGDRLLPYVNWQRAAVVRKLSAHTHFKPRDAVRLLEEAGFAVDTCEVLREYKGRPWSLGLSGRKKSVA